MRTHRLVVPLACLLAAPLAAQTPSLERLAFMAGCWQGPTTTASGPATLEEHWTSPSANAMLGTSRVNAGGRTVGYEFLLVQSDSSGIALIPYPRGVRSEHAFRLTRLDDTLAIFEAPEHDYPKRIVYRRGADGALVAQSDGGAADPAPRSWRLTAAACLAGPSVAQFAQAQRRASGPDRSGRVLLYVTQTLNGLWLGIAIPAMFEAENATAYGLGLLLGAPAGILFAKAVTDARPVSVGQATAIAWGGWWGWWTGLGLWAEVDGDNGAAFFGSTVAGMVGGTAVGLYLARNPISAGDASLVAHASVWGTWYGTVLAVLTEADDAWPWVLGAGNAALLGAALSTRHVEMSAGRVWVTTAAGLAGAFAGLGLDLIVQPEDENVAILIPAATSFAGLVLGLGATRRFDNGRLSQDAMPVNALLAVRDGRAQLNLPLPEPTLLPRDEGMHTRWTPGLRVTLFDLRH